MTTGETHSINGIPLQGRSIEHEESDAGDGLVVGLAPGHRTVSVPRSRPGVGRHAMTSGSTVPAPARAYHRRLYLVALAVAVTVASGCTKSGTAVSSPFGTNPPVLEHGPTYEVKVADVSGLGPVLVDGQGITVYLFETDHQGSPSRCYGICAIQWPPLILPSGVAAPIAGPGIHTRLLGTGASNRRDRPDHLQRLAALSLATGSFPGTATGQALTNAGGRWYVVDPSGTPVQPP